MRNLLRGLALLSLVAILTAGRPADALGAEIKAYRITVRHEPSKLGPAVEGMYRDVEASIDYFSLRLPFPRPVEVLLRDCSQVNAFYEPALKRVTVCYELIDFCAKNAVRLFPQGMAGTVVHHTVIYVLGHELAHAFVALGGIRTSGPAEDTADELSAYLTETSKLMRGFAAVGALAFHLREEGEDQDVWDEHAPPRRRIAALACLSHGVNPAAAGRFLQNIGQAIGEVRGLERRAGRCQAEWARVSAFWQKYVRDEAQRGTFVWLDPGATGQQTPACGVDCGDWCCPTNTGCGKSPGACLYSLSGSLSWTVTNACAGKAVQLRYFDMSNDLRWPDGADQVYSFPTSAVHRLDLSCVPGARICYGARVVEGTSYWGVDIDGAKGCKDCCAACGGPAQAARLTCQ